jgi:fermentation-respiration switch protein FrsA (DUF1100 family)
MRFAAYSGLLVAAFVSVLAILWWFQRRLIYFPLEPRLPPVESVLPGGSELRFTTVDGLELGGWWIPPRARSLDVTAMVFNGNSGSRADRATLAAGLAERGLAVFLFDYRGFAENPGTPSENGLIRDALAARSYLDSRADVRQDRVIYFGESLGAAVALALAVERPPAALVLRSPFVSLVEAGRFHYPFLPVGWILRDRFPSIERIVRTASPLLVFAGTADRVVPYAQSRALYDAAVSAEKRFVTMDGADHNDFDLVAGPRMLGHVVEFLAEVGITSDGNKEQP